MMISIIIPTLNEAVNIGQLVRYLTSHATGSDFEIIITDGGSTDNTIEVALKEGAFALAAPAQGRAAQMNFGAAMARGDILYFVHADTYPPATFATDICRSVSCGFDFGRYSTKFQSDSLKLKINAFFTRFDFFVCYGGDQTLFITKKLFNQLNGYNAGLMIMEDYDITVRAKAVGKYIIMPGAALVSARKYDHNSWWKIQKANYAIVTMYKKGIPQKLIMERYNELIKYR